MFWTIEVHLSPCILWINNLCTSLYKEMHHISSNFKIKKETTLSPNLLQSNLEEHRLKCQWYPNIESSNITFTLIFTLFFPTDFPSPTATTSPPWGLLWAVSGSKIPPSVVSSASLIFTSTLSPRGLTVVCCMVKHNQKHVALNIKTQCKNQNSENNPRGQNLYPC